MTRSFMRLMFVGLGMALALAFLPSAPAADITRLDVEDAIKQGIRYLKSKQLADGSWREVEDDAQTGTTSLVTLALLTAGVSSDSPEIRAAIDHLKKYSSSDLNSTYAIALRLMVFHAAGSKRIEELAIKMKGDKEWLEGTQITAGDGVPFPGSWSYTASKNRPGDNSNTQYALLGLLAATESDFKVDRRVWTEARRHLETTQKLNGAWGYQDRGGPAFASMTCAGISGLIIAGHRLYEGLETLDEGTIAHCGEGGSNEKLGNALNWLAMHFSVLENSGYNQQWLYYYYYGLERAGRLSGNRYFGAADWYREGARELVAKQDRAEGFWRGSNNPENNPLIATSFSLLFLAKGRAPVLINKLVHGEGLNANPNARPRPGFQVIDKIRVQRSPDWNNDPDDVRNLVNDISAKWKSLMTWQYVDPNDSNVTVEDMLQAPIVFFNGHEAPRFTPDAIKKLRAYIDQGGFIFAEACCSRPEFDGGFRDLMRRVFPEKDYELQAIPKEHAVWRADNELIPSVHPLWGINYGCRTVMIYSPGDLSCYWNLSETVPAARLNPALKVGENVVAYATGKELPADKLTVRDVRNLRPEVAKRGALQVGKLIHAGDWNLAPLAMPNLMTTLRDKLQFDVVISQRDIAATDPNLINFPLVYVHGRASFKLDEKERVALRQHLDLGGGTLFADAACGSEPFDVAFRKEAAALFPSNKLVHIPTDDDLFNKNGGGYDLKDVQYSKAAGGRVDFPELEGVKINGHWAIIYSKYDIGCALERHSGLECKGYSLESASRIATNIVIYSTLP